MSEFVEGVRTRASAVFRRIVFPEDSDPRVAAAIRELEKRKIVQPIVVQPATDARRADVASALLRSRERKGMTPPEAERLAQSPLFFGAWMVREGHADGCVAGAANTTADVLRAALWL